MAVQGSRLVPNLIHGRFRALRCIVFESPDFRMQPVPERPDLGVFDTPFRVHHEIVKFRGQTEIGRTSWIIAFPVPETDFQCLPQQRRQPPRCMPRPGAAADGCRRGLPHAARENRFWHAYTSDRQEKYGTLRGSHAGQSDLVARYARRTDMSSGKIDQSAVAVALVVAIILVRTVTQSIAESPDT